MRNLEVSSRGGSNNDMGGKQEIKSLEIKWNSQLREVASRVDGMAVFVGGRWFISQMDCVYFSTKHIPEGEFQWFNDIVSYLNFFKGETVSIA